MSLGRHQGRVRIGRAHLQISEALVAMRGGFSILLALSCNPVMAGRVQLSQ